MALDDKRNIVKLPAVPVLSDLDGESVCCIQVGDIALLQASWKLSAIDADRKPFGLSSRTAEVVRQQPNGLWLYVVDHAFANDF